MDKREELEPCPFCGSNSLELDCYSRNSAGECLEPAVNCNGCGGIFIFDFKLIEPWADLRGSWNTRAALSTSRDGELREAYSETIWEAYYDGETHKVVDGDGELIGKFLDAGDARLAAEAPRLLAALVEARRDVLGPLSRAKIDAALSRLSSGEL